MVVSSSKSLCSSIIADTSFDGQGELCEQTKKLLVIVNGHTLMSSSSTGDSKTMFPFSILAYYAPSPDRETFPHIQVDGPHSYSSS